MLNDSMECAATSHNTAYTIEIEFDRIQYGVLDKYLSTYRVEVGVRFDRIKREWF